MNGIVLPGLFLALVIFGYFTVGRWLQRSCFELPPRPPTDEEREELSPLMALAAHAGTVPGLITMVSVLIALYWGWTPAYVWILVGTTIGGLVFFLGNRYWSNFIAPQAPLEQYEETGAKAITFGHGLILVTLLATAAMMIALSALLMPAHPGLVFSLAMAFPAWICFRNSTRAPRPLSKGRLGWGLLSLACLLAGVALGHNIAVSITVNWQPAPALFPGVVITERVVWAVLLLIGFVGVARQPTDDGNNATTHLNMFCGLLLLVLIAVLALSVMIGNQEILLPAHSTDESTPSFFWLFMIVFVGGLLSASRGIVSLERRYLEGGETRHALHFAGFATDGMLAVLVLTAIATTAGTDSGGPQFAAWPGQMDIGQLLNYGSAALANAVASTGISASMAKIAVLFVLQLSAWSFLTHVLMLSRRLLHHAGLPARLPENIRGSAATLAVVIFTGLLIIGGPGLDGWLLLGLLNALTVGMMMLYVIWTLVRNEQSFIPVFVVGLLVVLAAVCQGIYAISGWFAAGQWGSGIAAVLIMLAAAIPLFSLLRLVVPALEQRRSALDLFDRE